MSEQNEQIINDSIDEIVEIGEIQEIDHSNIQNGLTQNIDKEIISEPQTANKEMEIVDEEIKELEIIEDDENRKEDNRCIINNEKILSEISFRQYC